MGSGPLLESDPSPSYLTCESPTTNHHSTMNTTTPPPVTGNNINREQLKTDLKRRLLDYVESNTKKGTGGFYVCPLCGSGTGPNGSAAFSLDSSKGNTTWHCFSCDKGGDLFDLIGQKEGLSFTDSLKRAGELFRNQAAPSKPEPEKPRQVVDFTPFIEQAQKAISRTDYPQRRGLTPATIERFRLGYYDPKDTAANETLIHLYGYDPIKSPALIIPYPGTGYWIARRIDPQADMGKHHKPKAEKAGEEPLFNIETMHDRDTGPVFIVEAPLDAISIIQAGGQAVAASGTSRRRLLNDMASRPPRCPVIIAADDDGPGEKAATELEAALQERNAPHIKADLFKGTGAKDANELLQRDPAALQRVVLAAIGKADPEAGPHFATSAAHRMQGFLDGIADSVNTPCTPTGFPKLDELLDGGLYEGLYIIGAVSSMGKTTFALQVADNIARAGRDVLFFSLEMAASEIIGKSISRLTFELCGGSPSNAKTTRGILAGRRHTGYNKDERALIRKAIEEYHTACAPHIFINEGVGEIGIDRVRETVKRHIRLTGNAPVVLIDYLQILAPHSERATDKQNTDKAVLELKRISRDHKLPIIGISSFNRANYNGPASLEAYKESGAIEYSADVLLAIQPHEMGQNKGQGKQEEQDKTRMNQYKAADTRKGELRILKNRNGVAFREVSVSYNAKFNHFRELDSKEYIEPDNEPTPF